MKHHHHQVMASSLPTCEPLIVVEEEDYIDMDISSSSASSLLRCTVHSPPHCSRDFEFQMSSSSNPLPEIDGMISPADELFYKGKLLPLHLPPRLQLLQKLLRDSVATYHADHAPFDATATATATPYESPATSCYVSGELSSEDYFVECQKDTKRSWAKKLKSIKRSSLCHKLKAPRAYLRSLFARSGCSDESAKKTGSKTPPGHAQKAASLLGRIDGERMAGEEGCGHRRSFSGPVKRRPSNNSCSASSSCSSSNSSSFSSANSNGLYGPQVLKRSSGANSEVECSILGAIAYCKKSQQEACVSDVEFYSLPASRIVADCEKLERPETCRGAH